MASAKEINEIHDKAMSYAADADLAALRGDATKAKRLLAKAFAKEKMAATLVLDHENAEPTRSILLRSAASLAIEVEEIREAEKLVCLALAGDPPEFICEQLRDLQETISFQRHLSSKGLEVNPTQFQMAISGKAVGLGFIEGKEFLRRANVLERMLQRILQFRSGMKFSENPQVKNKPEGGKILFSTARAGSYALTIRIATHKQQMFAFAKEENPAPEQIVDTFLEAVKLFNDGDNDGLCAYLPDESYRNNFVALAKRLAPNERDVSLVGFTKRPTQGGEYIAALTHKPHMNWSAKKIQRDASEVRGKLVSADGSTLKKHKLVGIEVNSRKIVKLEVKPGTFFDVVKPYWGTDVVVLCGNVGKSGHPLLEAINGIDEDQD